jgi:hypothetical protein
VFTRNHSNQSSSIIFIPGAPADPRFTLAATYEPWKGFSKAVALAVLKYRLIPDCAVEMTTGIGSSGEPGGAKAEASSFDIVYRAWLWDGSFIQAFAKELEFAVRY